MMKRKGVVLRLGLVMATSLGWLTAAADGTQKFVSKQFSYSVEYPSSWYFTGDHSSFNINDFPSSRAVRGVVIPPGGQGIGINVPSELRFEASRMPRTLDEWATKANPHQQVIARQTMELRDLRHKISVIEIRALCCGQPPFLESFQWYFEVDGHFFCASAGHWKSDLNSGALLDTLRRVVLSLRVVR